MSSRARSARGTASKQFIDGLAKRLTKRFGKGVGAATLRRARGFSLTYRRGSALPAELGGEIRSTALIKSGGPESQPAAQGDQAGAADDEPEAWAAAAGIITGVLPWPTRGDAAAAPGVGEDAMPPERREALSRARGFVEARAAAGTARGDAAITVRREMKRLSAAMFEGARRVMPELAVCARTAQWPVRLLSVFRT